jgi:hypothetical protein
MHRWTSKGRARLPRLPLASAARRPACVVDAHSSQCVVQRCIGASLIPIFNHDMIFHAHVTVCVISSNCKSWSSCDAASWKWVRLPLFSSILPLLVSRRPSTHVSASVSPFAFTCHLHRPQVTHLVVFNKTDIGTNMRVGRLPRGRWALFVSTFA